MFSKNALATVLLLTTLVAVVATSTQQDFNGSGTFEIQSDCVTPARSETITVSAGAVTAPGATSYTDFGFPQTTVSFSTEQSGPVGASLRVCTPTYGSTDQDAEAWIFSCADNGTPRCSILITKP